MISTFKRKITGLSALGILGIKLQLDYVWDIWLEFLLQLINVAVFIFFWRAVYGDTQTIAGMSLQQTLIYIVMAQILAGLLESDLIFEFGYSLREGALATELLRPVDFQLQHYIRQLSRFPLFLVQKVPLLLLTCLLFNIHLPTDPLVWGAFFLSVMLGYILTFFFEWMFACLAFCTTEIRGLFQMRAGLARFMSGSLIPLVMMPGWLNAIARGLPFAQAVSAPVSLLSGSLPLDQAPRIWLVQGLWLIGLAILSRLVFHVTLRRVTIQGG